MRNLNKPPRYNVASVQAQQTLGGDVMESAEDGQYVEWRDYAWLFKEVERLKAEIADEKSANAIVEGRLNSANRGLSMRNHLLQAEVERLRDGVETMTYHAPGVETTAWVRAVEYDRLKAQVERLAKAGDAMADNCEAITSSEHDCYDSDLMKFVRAWNAAKEGKPNA